MLVVALLRCTDLRPEVDPITGEVHRDIRSMQLSAADAAALEHALRAAEALGGRVLAVTAGPPGVEGALRDALAVGAEVRRVARGSGRTALGSPTTYLSELGDDERQLARALVAAIGEQPDLVLCADRSADRGTGALPAYVAHELGAAQALGLVSLEVRDGELVGERRLDAGRRERLRIPLPAVCSVEGAGVRLRRAGLAAAAAAAGAEVPAVEIPRSPSPVRVVRARAARPRTRVVAAPASADPRERLLALTGGLADREPPTVLTPATPAEAADALLAFLTRHGYLEGSP